MLCPAIEESLEIGDYCYEVQCLRVMVSCLLLRIVTSIKHTKAMTMEKSSDPTDRVRKVLE